jgi:hypothetical protein
MVVVKPPLHAEIMNAKIINSIVDN